MKENIEFKNNNSFSSSKEESLVFDASDSAVTFDKEGNPLSYFEDDVWDFVGEQDVKFGGEHRVSFTSIDKRFKDEIKRVIHLLYIQKKKQISISHINNYKFSLHNVSKIINSTNWSILDSDFAYRNFKEKLKSQRLSKSTVEQIATSIRFLFDNGLTKRFIDYDEGFLQLACKTKITAKQYIAIPENMANKLFSCAIEIVEKYHPYMNQISMEYDEYFSAYEDYSKDRTRTRNFAKDVGKNIKSKIPFEEFKLCGEAKSAIDIQTACLLAVVGFSGVRITEALSFNPNSYNEIRFKDVVVPILKGMTSKANKRGVPYEATWVTHPIAKKALELAYHSSEFARKRHSKRISLLDNDMLKEKYTKELSSAFVRLSVNKKGDGILSTSAGTRFRRFMKNHGVVATEADIEEFNTLNPTRHGNLSLGGYLPKLSPHDFRRTFAVFLVRNHLGNLMSLKYQYKHLNVAMSAWYANNSNLATIMDMALDSDLQDEIDKANIDINTETLYHIFNEEEILSGKEGKRIMAEREKHSKTIYQSREEIRTKVLNGTLSIVEHPTGYCVNPSCDRICASDKSTETCQHEIITRDKVIERGKKRDRLIIKFNSLNTKQFYMASILKNIEIEIKAIEKLLLEHKISFEPFKGNIIALSMRQL